jgi:hypothetical protein
LLSWSGYERKHSGHEEFDKDISWEENSRKANIYILEYDIKMHFLKIIKNKLGLGPLACSDSEFGF